MSVKDRLRKKVEETMISFLLEKFLLLFEMVLALFALGASIVNLVVSIMMTVKSFSVGNLLTIVISGITIAVSTILLLYFWKNDFWKEG